MKKLLKDMMPVTILAFLASFIVYIYEPIITYSTNVNDFWFDFKLASPVNKQQFSSQAQLLQMHLISIE